MREPRPGDVHINDLLRLVVAGAFIGAMIHNYGLPIFRFLVAYVIADMAYESWRWFRRLNWTTEPDQHRDPRDT